MHLKKEHEETNCVYCRFLAHTGLYGLFQFISLLYKNSLYWPGVRPIQTIYLFLASWCFYRTPLTTK